MYFLSYFNYNKVYIFQQYFQIMVSETSHVHVFKINIDLNMNTNNSKNMSMISIYTLRRGQFRRKQTHSSQLEEQPCYYSIGLARSSRSHSMQGDRMQCRSLNHGSLAGSRTPHHLVRRASAHVAHRSALTSTRGAPMVHSLSRLRSFLTTHVVVTIISAFNPLN